MTNSPTERDTKAHNFGLQRKSLHAYIELWTVLGTTFHTFLASLSGVDTCPTDSSLTPTFNEKRCEFTLSPGSWRVDGGPGWWKAAGGWWLGVVPGGWWLAGGEWWLVIGGWWMVAGGWLLAAGR